MRQSPRLEGEAHAEEAARRLVVAEQTLRIVNQSPYLPRVLLAVDFLRRLQRRFADAHKCLGEALLIVKRAGMNRIQADVQLDYARLYLDQEEEGEARKCCNEAKGLVVQMGHGRRKWEGQALEGRLSGGRTDVSQRPFSAPG